MNVSEQNLFPWQGEEGQLAVDVLETPESIIIRSAIAGVKPENLDVHVTTDIVTIRGERAQSAARIDQTIHFQECFWGTFSRSIVLPAHVIPEEADASVKNGVLTLTVPKIAGEAHVPIREDIS